MAIHFSGGAISPSDSKRFPVTIKMKNAATTPKYSGYGRILPLDFSTTGPRIFALTRIIHKNIALPGTSDRLSVSYQLNDANPDSSNLGMD